MMSRETYTLTLTDLGGSPVPVGRRLAQLLKRALRDHRLRCVDARQVAQTTTLPVTDDATDNDALPTGEAK